MSALSFFRWCDSSWLGEQIRASTYLFPAIEVFHLFGLVVLMGTILTMDMRLMGVGLRRPPVTQLARDLKPWTLVGLAVMLSTGFLLFSSEALKCYGNIGFWYKMSFLGAALAFHFTVFRKVTSSDVVPLGWERATGCVSLILWLGVGLGGRAIAFV